MSWRLRHWTFGIARYERDRLEWFRTFSLSPLPRCSLTRGSVQVSARRNPRGTEAWHLVPEAVVLECANGDGFVEIALPAPAVVGFLAWLEASPSHSRFAAGTHLTSPFAPLATRARMNNRSDSRLR